MDWKKIKSILLVTLIITNSILAFNIYDIKNNGKIESDENLNKVKLLLEKKGVSFDQDIKLEFPETIKSIAAKYKEYDLSNISKIISKNPMEIDDLSYKNGKESLSVENDILKYKNTDALKDLSMVEEEELIKKSEEFIEMLELDLEYEFSVTSSSEEKTQILFNQVIDGYVINGGYMSFIYSGYELYRYESKLMEILEFNDDKANEIIPIDKVLFDKMDFFEDGDIIETIELGYNFSTNEFNSEILYGELSPYYIVKIVDKEAFLVRALE